MTLGYLDRLSTTRRREGEGWDEEEERPSGGSRVESQACESRNVTVPETEMGKRDASISFQGHTASSTNTLGLDLWHPDAKRTNQYYGLCLLWQLAKRQQEANTVVLD